VSGAVALFAGTFSALNITAKVVRDSDDPLNGLIAGGITGGAFAVRMKTGPGFGIGLGMLLGGALGGCSWLASQLMEVPNGSGTSEAVKDDAPREPLAVASVVASLEEMVEKHRPPGD